MNLEDIDILVSSRSSYMDAKRQLEAVRLGPPKVLEFSGTFIKNTAALRAAREAVEPIIQKQFDEIQAKLMLLGVTKFPE